MLILIAGLTLFFAVHLLPAVPGVRPALVQRAGEGYYKGAFALLALTGLALIIGGYAAASPGARLFAPSPTAMHIAPYAMTLSFILLAAAHMRSHIRRVLRHPMLLGVLIWASVHLIANGDARGTLLFASFLVYAVVAAISAEARHTTKAFEANARYDLLAVAGGAIAALAVMTLHRFLFGVAAVPWGA